MQGESAGQLSQVNRKEWCREVPRQPGFEVLAHGSWTPDVDLPVGLKQGAEEAKALDVIRVQVGEQNVDAAGSNQVRSETPYSCPGIEDQRRTALRTYLHAGSVASVSHCFRPGAGERAPGTP